MAKFARESECRGDEGATVSLSRETDGDEGVPDGYGPSRSRDSSVTEGVTTGWIFSIPRGRDSSKVMS